MTDITGMQQANATLLFFEYFEDAIQKTKSICEALCLVLVLVLASSVIYNNLLLRLSVSGVLTLASKILLNYGNFQVNPEALKEECGCGPQVKLDSLPAGSSALPPARSLSLGRYPTCLCLGSLTYKISAGNIFKAFRMKSGK